ncbi:MAG TPA: aldo/keto reductase [Acidimicrobiales bacterium]|nr:aldo/keto reductase [Acidimicrobiales bacterium]
MRYRTFGRSGLRVSELVLGAMTFGHDERWGGSWGTPPEQCRALVEAYAEAGGNVIDTANRYTGGHSEEIVGEAVAGERERFVLSTKYTVTNDGRDPNASGNHRKSLVRSLDQSLRRLRTDHVDILWVHIWDAGTPIEETVRALDDAVRAGKVLYVGISDTPAWVVARGNTLAELRGWTPFTGLQVPYSLAQREAERELLPMAAAFGMAVTAWSPLAGGLLTGKYLDGGTVDPSSRLAGSDISERDQAIAREVAAVAAELGVSSAQTAIAWTRAHSPDVHPIVAARTVGQLRDNLGAVDVVLPDAAVARLDAVSAIDAGFPTDMIAGTRGFVYGPVGELVDVPR